MRNRSIGSLVLSPTAFTLALGMAATSAASAGLVWDSGNPNNLVEVSFGVEEPFLVTITGSWAMADLTPAFGADSVSITAATASGFSASMTQASGGGVRTTIARYFSVSGSVVDLSIWGTPTSDVTWRIISQDILDGSGNPLTVLQLDFTAGQVYSQDFRLAAGQYAVELIGSADAGGTYDGTFGNFSIVPSPGAMAIVGLAGLVGRRRRG